MKRITALAGLLLMSASPLAAEQPARLAFAKICPTDAPLEHCGSERPGIADTGGHAHRLSARDAAAIAPRIQLAADESKDWKLKELLDVRKLWGSTKAPTPVAQADLEKALKALLAERVSWGNAPSHSSSATTTAAGNAAKAGREPTALDSYLSRRDSWGTPAGTAAAASAAPVTLVTMPTDLAAFLKERETWGLPKAKPVAAPLAAGAPRKLRFAEATPVKDDGRQPIMHAADTRPIPVVAEVPAAKVTSNLKSLLAERASWGEAPKLTSTENVDPPMPTDLAAYLKERETWGLPKAKPVAAPLAAGAPRKLRFAETAPVKDDGRQPIMHAADTRPIPVVAEVPAAKVTSNLKSLLAERASWGEAPKLTSTENVDPPMPTDLAAYLKERETWGLPKARPVAAPLAAGAPRKLRFAEATPVKDDGRQPIMHAADTRPIPVVAEVPAAKVTSNLKSLLAERASWGEAPKLTSTENVDPPMPTDLAAYLMERETWGLPKAKPVAAPPAAGAPRKLRFAEATPVKDDGRQPIVHAGDTRPLPTLEAVAGAKVKSALDQLLNQRATWGLKPSLASAEPSETTAQPTPTTVAAAAVTMPTKLTDYLKTRATWGRGPAGTSSIETAAIGKLTRTAAATPAPAVSPDRCTEDLRRISTSGTILFELASAELTPDSTSTLNELASVMRGCSGVRIRIDGHTDSLGKYRVNQALSEARAKVVANYMAKAGIDPTILRTKGFGEAKPIVGNDTPENRAKNRRIEFTVLTR